MKIFTAILRTLALACALVCISPAVAAKDYTTTLAENVSVTYAVNTTDLIARVKRVYVFTGTPPKSIEVPKTVKYKSGDKTYSLTVTKIGDGAFEQVEIKKIVLPNTITYIGNDAFNFSYVENLNIPTSVETIGDRAFYCSSIKSAVIPGTCKSIGTDAFKDCEIESVTFEESRTPLSIGKSAFEWSKLKSVTLPFRLSSMGACAFVSCRWLTNVNIMSATTIPEQCFNYCTSLRSVRLPSGVTAIGEMAFQDCWQLESFDSLLPALRTIGSFAFCRAGLNAINLPEGLMAIGNHAFEDNVSLKRITFPSTLKNIGDDCFAGCDAIESVSCDAVTPPVAGVNCFTADCSKIPAYVPEQSVSAYERAYCWSAFDYSHYKRTGVESVLSEDARVMLYDLQGRPLPDGILSRGVHIEVTDNHSRIVLK